MFWILLLLLSGPLLMVACGNIHLQRDWRTADRTSAEIAPNPTQASEAIVQVYAARAFNWRGLFAVHTWIATKPENAPHFTVHQVVGWRAWRNLPVVVSKPDLPDRYWYGNRPELITELRGVQASHSIAKIHAAIDTYPYMKKYVLWPGPNSNTFTAYIARSVPELQLDLPVTAIGKDFLADGNILAHAPSGTGYQFSLYGLLGVIAAWREGLELNLLGLNLGIDLLRPALKLPGIGRLGITPG